jgi:hypothetical protein
MVAGQDQTGPDRAVPAREMTEKTKAKRRQENGSFGE